MSQYYIVKEYFYYFMYKINITKEQFCQLCEITMSDFEALENNIFKKRALEKIADMMGYAPDLFIIDLDPILPRKLGRPRWMDKILDQTFYFD